LILPRPHERMNDMTQREKAETFSKLHEGTPILVLLNVWDVAGALIVEEAGFPAIATSSAAIANSLGLLDGQRITRSEMAAVVARIAAAVHIPVTADMEAGYGDLPVDAAATARAALEAGAVGLNIEDGTGIPNRPLIDIQRQAEKIRAMRQVADAAKVPLVINARIDTFLRQAGDEHSRLDETIRRACAFRKAGADCVFVPALRDPAAITALLMASPGPLNLLGGTGTPTIPDLERLGVARLSLGAGPYRAALGLLRRIAGELGRSGTYREVTDGMVSTAEMNRLLEDAGKDRS
jgi:2-methylisocitrate lyase-like PEP mutase family enzyme